MTKAIDWPAFERVLKEEITLSTTPKELDRLYRDAQPLLDVAKVKFSLYHEALIELFRKRKQEIANGL